MKRLVKSIGPVHFLEDVYADNGSRQQYRRTAQASAGQFPGPSKLRSDMAVRSIRRRMIAGDPTLGNAVGLE